MTRKQIDVTTLRRAYVQYGFYVVPTVVVTVVFWLTILVLIPGIKQGLEASQKLRAERGRLTKLTDKLVALQRLDRADLLRRAGVVEQVLPSSKDVGSFLLGIRRVAGRSGVALTSVDLSPGKLEAKASKSQGAIAKAGGSGETGTLAIEVKLVGGVSSVAEFLGQIQKTVPVMGVKAVEISGEAGSFQAKVSLEGNYWPRPESLGRAEEALPRLTAAEEQLFQEVLSLAKSVESVGGEAEVPVGNPNLMGQE